ncbi:MAG: transposase [Acidobacteria bacterium]|jgi:REP element-mobilizing transposase RayT|nr:transposase [Acidobacteriota bacterium]
MFQPSMARERPVPLACFITFSCYGHRLHGAEAGSVDRRGHVFGAFRLPADSALETLELANMRQAPYQLSPEARGSVLATIKQVCSYRGWLLLAAHVRTAHVHLVVRAHAAPERVMNDCKAYASRNLNLIEPGSRDRKRWARHGSTNYLWKVEDVEAAIQYAAEEQDEPMALFKDDNWLAKLRKATGPRA